MHHERVDANLSVLADALPQMRLVSEDRSFLNHFVGYSFDRGISLLLQPKLAHLRAGVLEARHGLP